MKPLRSIIGNAIEKMLTFPTGIWMQSEMPLYDRNTCCSKLCQQKASMLTELVGIYSDRDSVRLHSNHI